MVFEVFEKGKYNIAGNPQYIKIKIYKIKLVEKVKFQPVKNALFNNVIIGIKGVICIISDNIRYNFLDIDKNILIKFRENKTSWVAANYAGFHPFNALDFTRTLEIWDRVTLENLKRWERTCYKTAIFYLL